MLSSDCIYIYIYWRGGNKLKAVLAMGFAGWKSGDEESQGEGGGWCWRGRGAKIPPFWVEKERKKLRPHPCAPRGDLGVQEGILGVQSSMRGWGQSRSNAGPGVSPSEGQKPARASGCWQRVTGAGSGHALLHLGWFCWVFFFPAFPSGHRQRGAEPSMPWGEEKPWGPPMLKPRVSLFPSWDRSEKK